MSGCDRTLSDWQDRTPLCRCRTRSNAREWPAASKGWVCLLNMPLKRLASFNAETVASDA